MARTIKVSKEKVKKESTREAGDKKLAVMKKLREENQKRAQRMKSRKEKQLKIVREERIEKQRKIQRGMQALKEIQKYQKGADLLIQRLPFQRLVREIVQKRRRTKIVECGSLSIARSGGSLLGRAFGTGQFMHNSCKVSNHNAKRHSISMDNQRRFLKQRKIE